MKNSPFAVPETGPPQQDDDSSDVEEPRVEPTTLLSAPVRGMYGIGPLS